MSYSLLCLPPPFILCFPRCPPCASTQTANPPSALVDHSGGPPFPCSGWPPLSRGTVSATQVDRPAHPPAGHPARSVAGATLTRLCQFRSPPPIWSPPPHRRQFASPLPLICPTATLASPLCRTRAQARAQGMSGGSGA
jgi:hypothetical protein